MYPSVAFSLEMIWAGFPTTTELQGTSIFTYAFGAMRTLSPMVIPPTITALAPIQTSLPILGTPMDFPLLVCPMVTPCAMLQFLPMMVLGLITNAPQCPK